MATPLLNSQASASQLPATISETVFLGAGGIVSATDPTVGVRLSRQYGAALTPSTELLASVTKDQFLPTTVNSVGGLFQCAGIKFGNVIANTVGGGATQNAGYAVCGLAQLVNGAVVIQTTAFTNQASTNRSLVFLQRFDGVNPPIPSTVTGILSIGPQSGNAFTVNSLTLGGLVATGDVGVFAWLLINPDWNPNL